jgi:large subunit ribosomal protein L19
MAKKKVFRKYFEKETRIVRKYSANRRRKKLYKKFKEGGPRIMDIIKSIEHEQLKNKIPDLHIGDTVKVYAKVKEGNRERIQVFEGIIIKKQGGGVNATFTVRRISYGVGVEKTFLIHSPNVEKVEVTRVGKARRAKLYYLRDRVGKAAKTKEKIGARIETKEIVVKEEVVPGENEAVEEVVPVVEEVKEEVTPVVEEVKEEVAPVAEEVKEEVAPVAEEAKEEVPSVAEETKEETTETENK